MNEQKNVTENKNNQTKKDAFLAEKRQYFFVIRELTAREIKRKYARSYLGILWSVLNPLLTMVVMSLVFSTMFKNSITNFPIYYLTGSVIWTLFSTATNTSMNALVDNRTLLLKVKLPKQVFVLARVYTALVNFAYTCIAYVLMLLVFQVKVTWTILLFPIVVLFMLLFSLGIGYMLAIAYVFFADIKYLYSVLLTLVMYVSAIFYPVSRLSPEMQKVVGMNPIYVAIAIARDCIMNGTVSTPEMWTKLVFWSVGSFAIGYIVFQTKENKVMAKI